MKIEDAIKRERKPKKPSNEHKHEDWNVIEREYFNKRDRYIISDCVFLESGDVVDFDVRFTSLKSVVKNHRDKQQKDGEA